MVASKLRCLWSPQQIAGWLKSQYPGRPAMHVSHETIYQSLFIQTRGLLKAELLDCLRSGKRWRSARVSKRNEKRGQIADAISIRERPPEVEDRALPGHWEGDLLFGNRTSCIATLVERSSRFVMLVKVASNETAVVIDALIRQARKLPDELRKSLTWDRGKELAEHKRFALATDMKVYFCDPYSPWQRGTNENTNALLRQYFPKGEDVSHYTQAHLNKVARQLNERPRMTLGFRTPAETLEAALR
jgi:transposase, IS30 family